MISAIVLTKNEEDRIKACLKSLQWVDEILVVDSESTDKTTLIAKQCNAKALVRKFDNYVNQKNWAMQQISGDWVLYIDADERVLKPLQDEIRELIINNKYSALALSRRNIIFGQEKKYGPFWPDWIIRLVKKDDFTGWKGNVHETITFKGQLGYTKNSLLHLTHRNVDQVITKNLLWSKIDAKLRDESHHPKMSSWRFLRILFGELINQGVIRRGFFNGTVGTIDAILQTFSLVTTYIRLWETQQSKPLDQIYQNIDNKLIEDDFIYP